MAIIVNCHAHVFTSRSVPNGFLPFGLLRFLRTKTGAYLTHRMLTWLADVTNRDSFERLSAFTGIGNLEDEGAIFDLLQGYYPATAHFILLPVDMDFMGAGTAPVPYLDQLERLRRLKDDPAHAGRIHAFVAADPRRDGVTDLVKRYVDDYGFDGIKIYPALGFLPQDERLDPIYAYAVERDLPILTHCSRGGVYYKGKIRDLPVLDTAPRNRKRLARYTDGLSNPRNYFDVLKKFPDLKLCLAHMGGSDECLAWLKKPYPYDQEGGNWLSLCLDLVREHENVYIDMAYTAFEPELLALMKVFANTTKVRERLLFGSDFYMVQRDVTEREFSIDLRAVLGEADYERVAARNPAAFLGLNSL